MPWLFAFNVPYSNSTDGPPGCAHGTMFKPPWPQGYGYESERPDGVYTPGNPNNRLKSPKFNYEMVDKVKVPEEKGEYLVRTHPLLLLLLHLPPPLPAPRSPPLSACVRLL